MTIMGEDVAKPAAETVSEEASNAEAATSDDKDKQDPFSEENILKESAVSEPRDDGKGAVDIKITPEEKAAFIEAVATNTRFTKSYSLFGGKLSVTLRSLTTDEVNALAVWAASQGTKDAVGIVSGRYRKFLAAAHCAMVNGVEMPPLDEPLFERLGKDGKTVEKPGWIERGTFFDNLGYGQFQAIMRCIGEFDAKYAMMCAKAEDSTFWDPDTP